MTNKLSASGLNSNVMVDFSHANSDKQFKRQMIVCDDVCTQIKTGKSTIFGVMVESFIEEGNQKLIDGKAQVFGQSITDGCIGWSDTEQLLETLYQAKS